MSNTSESIPVVPKNGPTIFKVRLIIYNLVLNQGFSCACYLLDELDNVIEQRDLKIEGEEYDSWTSDEEMENLILSKLGLEPLPSQQ